MLIKRIVNGEEMAFQLTPEEIEEIRRQDKIQWAKDVLANYDWMMDNYDRIIKDEVTLVEFADLLEAKNLEDNGEREQEAIRDMFIEFPEDEEAIQNGDAEDFREASDTEELTPSSFSPQETEMFFGIDVYKENE